MIEKGKGVMTLEEMERAGIKLSPGHEEVWQTGHGPLTVLVQEPETEEGTYNPNAPEGQKIIRFHRGEQERKAA